MISYLQQTNQLLINNGLNSDFINNKKIRSNTILYMVYWFDRLKNNKEEQYKIKTHLINYFNRVSLDGNLIFEPILLNKLIELSKKYIQEEIVSTQTVDLIVERELNGKKEVLLMDRDKFPKGIVLPGGIVEDGYETNPLNVDSKIFTALKVAAEKVLHLDVNDRIYDTLVNEKSEISYIVKNKAGNKQIIIKPQDIYGYAIKENIKSVLRPSDPRHIVDTVGFKCELLDDNLDNKEYFWESKENLLNQKLKNNDFAFQHHKEIILNILGKSSVEEEINFSEHHFIKSIIKNPLESYIDLKEQFNQNSYASFPQLFPMVNKILKSLFSEEINELCKENPILLGFRDQSVNSLRHVSLKNRVFCPYLPTINAIFGAIDFFDVVTRHKKDFYNDLPTNEIIEHNPKEKDNAVYHAYKYEYRMNELLDKIPNEIVIPTFVNLSATELMKVRGIPIRFVGLSNEFIYVDEFEQSPKEYLVHDGNHSYRMIIEDEKYMAENNMPKEIFYKKQMDFNTKYLENIKISESDNEKTKELKKIKKIILFEVTHEDAKPFMPEIVLNALIRKEGGETKFELPYIDPKTHYMDIVDVLDTEISTLSYVRNKLQCGFYDKIDNQSIYIVNPQYRKSEYIAEAAYEMVYELSIMLNKKVIVDFDYLLQRVCSVGPNNIYSPVQEDKNIQKYTDGAEFLNPKRYQVK